MEARHFKTRNNATISSAAREQLRRVEMVLVSKLRPARHNAHQHPKKQIGQLADSIKRFGFINQVIIDHQGNIVAGHGRVGAAKLLRMRKVPVIRLSDLSETELRTYILPTISSRKRPVGTGSCWRPN